MSLAQKILLLSAVSLPMAGCLTVGNNFPSRTDWISKEKTNKEDVASVLGKPSSVGNSGGTATSTYEYYKYELFGAGFHKELKLYWNTDGSIKHYNFTSSFPEDVSVGEYSIKKKLSSKGKSETLR